MTTRNLAAVGLLGTTLIVLLVVGWRHKPQEKHVAEVAAPVTVVEPPPPMTPGVATPAPVPVPIAPEPVAPAPVVAPKPRAPRPVATPVPPKERPYTALLAGFFTAESLPQAQSIVDDYCDKERALLQDLDARRNADDAAGKPFDKQAELDAVFAFSQHLSKVRKELAKLPGSKMDKDAWKAFTQSTEYVDACEPKFPDDDE